MQPEPSKQPSREFLGSARPLLGKDSPDSAIHIEGTVDFPDYSPVPRSTLFRSKGNLEVTINIPTLILANLCLRGWNEAVSAEDLFALSHELSQDFQTGGQYFTELSYIPADKKTSEKLLHLTCDVTFHSLSSTKIGFDYCSLVYKVPEKEAALAAPRINRARQAIADFCKLRGLERAIESIADSTVSKFGWDKFERAYIPLPDSCSMVEVMNAVLPDIIKPSELVRGGSISPDKPLLEAYANRINVRIPCTNLEASTLSYYLNECGFAQRTGIQASYIEFPTRDPRVSTLIDAIVEKMSIDPAPGLQKTQRIEPGYWLITAQLDPNNVRPGIEALVQYLATFRDCLRRGAALQT